MFIRCILLDVHHSMSLCHILLGFTQNIYIVTNLKPVLFCRQFPTLEDRLPLPVITDLDGDGTNEILLVTHDFK